MSPPSQPPFRPQPDRQTQKKKKKAQAPFQTRTMQRACQRLALMQQRTAAAAAVAGPSRLLPAQGPLASLSSAAGRVVVGEGATKRRSRIKLKAALEMTESAAQRINELLQGRASNGQPAVAVRIGVKTRGCNGLSYTMQYAAEKERLEEEVEQHGARIFIEPKALMHVIGTKMDFVEDDLSSEFVFHNPNAEASCGCGESFTVAKG